MLLLKDFDFYKDKLLDFEKKLFPVADRPLYQLRHCLSSSQASACNRSYTAFKADQALWHRIVNRARLFGSSLA